LLYTNAQSVVNKMEELRVVVSLKRPDIIAITETWTNNDISDEFLCLDGYELIERKDREDTDRGRGGGILIFAIKGRCAWREPVEGCFEHCAKIKLRGKKSDLGINIIYRSPNSSSINDASLCELLKQIRGSFVLIGDFNFPGIRWGTGRSDGKGRAFYDEMEDNYLVQHVDEATHKSGNILDLVISKDEDLVESVEYEGRLGKSDHEMLMITVSMEMPDVVVPTNSRDYDRANFDEMRRELKEETWTNLNQAGVEESWSIIRKRLEQLVDDWVPWRRKSKRKNSPRWMNSEIRKAVTQKRNAWRKWKRSGREEEKREYMEWEKKTKRLIRNRKNALERQVATDSKINPKAFYSYINSARRNRNSIGPLKIDGKLVVEPKEQAEELNRSFSSFFTRCDVESPPKDQLTGIGMIENVTITEESVKHEIGRLRKFSAPGPDNITNRLLIELCDEIAKPLVVFFTKSLEHGKIPDDWRLSNVSPIYKQKGSKSQPGNYRPVSLTSNVCKLMEKVINKALSEHLENGVLSNSQHGFRKGRSCQTNLIEFHDKLTQWTDEGESVDVLYLDFRKAFDKVDHSRLMVKLAAAGVQGKLWQWLKDWLAGRRQRVVIGGEASDWLPVESGVPQGTVLGGPLFDVYVDDIDFYVLLLFLLKFADDTKNAARIKSQEDADRFQKDIDSLCKWASDWAMEFNTEKCKIMHIGRNNPRFKYFMNGVELSVTEEERDLGVWTESSLKPGLQCTKAAANANRLLGMILKSFHYRTKQSLVPLYKSLVRPKLEFAVAAWNPWLEKDIQCLEKVQRRLIRSLSNVRGTTYEEKLKDAGLTTLAERRKRGDLIEAFKTLNGMNNVDRSAWFEIAPNDEAQPSTRSNTNVDEGREEKRPCVLIRERARTDLRNNSFRFRVGRAWNELPDNVRTAKSTNSFKNAYDSWLARNGQN
jgi:ribonuclease P/MRP protein subunit RPP40